LIKKRKPLMSGYLEHLILSHETVEWGGPSFREDLEPLEIHLAHLDLGKSLGLSDLGFLLGSADKKLLDFWGSGLGSLGSVRGCLIG
jgi:hypothetical protein